MSSIILSNVAGTVGGALGGPVGKYIGSYIGGMVGNSIDNKLFGGSKSKVRGSRLSDLVIQSSSYGKMIPIVYGNARIGGNIIWSRPIREIETTTSGGGAAGGKGGGGRASQSTTSYSYTATLAIAICEGEIDTISRIWADAKLLDLSKLTHRIYKGSETQLPDSLIASIEGADKTPSYRGLAYVVFEDFQLADFGNRIPNFSFELQKKALYPDYGEKYLENEITGVTLIPGAGEYVYDTQIATRISGAEIGGNWVQQGNRQCINMHNGAGVANAVLAIDQLVSTCPNVEYVSVVASWFGDSLDAGSCVVTPGVEYHAAAVTSPHEWSVAGISRSSARLITFVNGSPQYGGTPDDNSLVNLVNSLRARGLKVAFYPMMFMDMDGKPWRGELTGSAADVSAFFTKTQGYNAFINHYVSLLAGKVDAFIIGSELKGLTAVTDSPGSYPAVTALVALATSVKATLGPDVVVTYAADWSEYHHTDGGWYNLDPLWASPAIDVIGIDAYFPLSNAQTSLYDVDAIKNGWSSGEGYDFYYSDGARTIETPLSPAMAWKNLAWFYHNTHVNPNASATAWVPASKKIWFTELGYPSVDCCTNQPNVFFDPSTSASAYPYFSRGRADIRAQRAALIAALDKWDASDIVERIFLWTWDARPFPYWPDLTSVWTDGGTWQTGHWLQGKLGISNLSAIVSDLCARSGLEPGMIDVSAINIPIEGFVISHQQGVRECIEALQSAFFFDAVESDHRLDFIPRGRQSALTIDADELIVQQTGSLRIVRKQEVELPKRINVMYINRLTGYQPATQYAQRQVTGSREVNTVELPLVMSDQLAKNIADISLYTSWLSRVTFEFTLPPRYMALEPSDVIELDAWGVTHTMRILTTKLVSGGIQVTAVAEDISSYDFYQPPGIAATQHSLSAMLPDTQMQLLDIPALPGDNDMQGYLRAALCGRAAGWSGAAIYRSDDAGANYARLADGSAASAIGTAAGILGDANPCLFDEKNSLTVYITGVRSLQSVTPLAVLNGANAALVGNEIIQFKNATLVGENTYQLSGLLRGRLGTEWATNTHAAGEVFVLLDSSLVRVAGGNDILQLARLYKAVTYGAPLSAGDAQDFTYQGVALKPYSPVHVKGARDIGGNLSITWVRRTRIGGQWRDGADVPLSEASEAYEIDIMDGGNVIRTLSAAAVSANYSAAQQTADFGSPQAHIDLCVYQLSALVGRGYGIQATI